MVLATTGSAGCQPRLGEFEVTNSTDETLVLWDLRITPGATREFEMLDEDCLSLVLFSDDGTQQVVIPEVCEDDRAEVVAADLEPAAAATVVNGATEPVEVRYIGWSSIRAELLEPGSELRIPLDPAQARCGDDEGPQLDLVVVRPDAPPDAEALARYLGEVCADTRWVLDDETLRTEAGSP